MGTNRHDFILQEVDDLNRRRPTSTHMSSLTLKMIERNIPMYQDNPPLTLNVYRFVLLPSKGHSGTIPIKTSSTREKAQAL